ncbi:MAG: amidohydrolase family protein [Pseudorhodoplanes sp.]|uniref:amidohydrolase family protein n=1 Tax=Pseudorhodoplanes sp. TaxID=1934341 RepID=UPI003D0E89A2
MGASDRSVPRRVIDFRSRPNTPEYLVALRSPVASTVMRKLGSPQPQAGTLEEWVAGFQKEGVERVVFTGRQSQGTSGHDVTNEYVAETALRFPGVVIGFAGIDPLQGMTSVRAVEHAVRKLGLKGVSIDPYGGNVAPNDRRLYPVYAKCAELDVPVVVTCGPLPFPGPRLDHGDVRGIDDVACDFPELTIVVDHSGWPWVTETIAILFRHDNVFIDTSLYMHLPGTAQFAEAANSIVPDRMLFASCYPVVPVRTAIERVSSLPFTPQALDNVMYATADRLLRKFRCY